MDYCSGVNFLTQFERAHYHVLDMHRKSMQFWSKNEEYGPYYMDQVVERCNLGQYSSFLDQNMHTFPMNFQNGIMNS